MKVRCIFSKSKFLKKGKIYEVLEECEKSYKIIDEDGTESWFYKYKFEEVKEMKELTFKEVIANIKEGEVWESCYIKVIKTKNRIDIDTSSNCPNIGIGDTVKFKLKRKEYTFEEAFKAYEEGKEIESAVSSISYQKKHDEEIFIIAKEIRGKWYIND